MSRLIDADALKAKAFGDRKGLIHTADVDTMPEAIVRCCECEKWDSGNALTVQTCFEWGRPTKQLEYCSRGRKKST